MNDSNVTRMFLTTAVLAAVAALLAVPSQAMFRSGDSALVVDRAVASANDAYDSYRDKTAIAARQTLFTGQPPSVGLTGDSAPTRDDISSLSPTTQAVSSGDDFNWGWVGIGG